MTGEPLDRLLRRVRRWQRDHRGERLLLDLFCKAGGAGMGYSRAGFAVFGIDLEPQPRYPFDFGQADALDFLRAGGAAGFHVVHASPPCQAYSSCLNLAKARGCDTIHPELVEPVRDLLIAWGGVWVIENVPGAPLLDAVLICGSSFGLDLRRHRLFESNVALMAPRCAHGWQTPRFATPYNRYHQKTLATVVGVYGARRGGAPELTPVWARAMEIDWMNRFELAQAIPPVYTELIGAQLLDVLWARRVPAPCRPRRVTSSASRRTIIGALCELETDLLIGSRARRNSSYVESGLILGGRGPPRDCRV